MARLSVFLASLLIVLTFNAYACILPLQAATDVDCTSGTEEPVRGTCDAFLEIGPHSQPSFHDAVTTVHLACASSTPLFPDTGVPLVRLTKPPWNAETPLHRSIRTTVLRM
jgi:hypothetical protein